MLLLLLQWSHKLQVVVVCEEALPRINYSARTNEIGPLAEGLATEMVMEAQPGMSEVGCPCKGLWGCDDSEVVCPCAALRQGAWSKMATDILLQAHRAAYHRVLKQLCYVACRCLL